MIPLSEIEYSAYSQNGEDGIIEFLLRGPPHERFFIEIGSGNGRQNNTSHLADHGWRGVAIDRKKERVAAYNVLAADKGWGSVGICQRATTALARQLALTFPEPGLFSLDIDSVDWHIANAMLDAGFRPSIAVVEYNAAFGKKPLSVPYDEDFRTRAKHIHFGAGLWAWRKLFDRNGYRFVTVESRGVNAFFVRADCPRVREVAWLSWTDNDRLAEELGPAEERFAAMADWPLVECA